MAKAGITMQITGTKKVILNLNKAGTRGIKAVGAGLYLEGNNIISDSLPQVPVDQSALKNSKYVTLPEITAQNITVELGYGGEAKEYAVVQHEHTEFKHPGGGKAKFLQDPMYAAMGGFTKNVLHFAQKAFQLGIGAKKTSVPDKPK